MGFNLLKSLINSCKKEDRKSQKLLYKQFYGYGMSIALRYCQNKEEAIEVYNDSFLKVFTREIMTFDEGDNVHEGVFKAWLQKIIIYTAIDYFRKNNKHYYHESVDDVHERRMHYIQPVVTDTIAYEEMLTIIKKLSPAYYTVFCMYVIDDFTHEEIAEILGISVGTSKSNLAKARMRLKEIIKKERKDEYARYIG